MAIETTILNHLVFDEAYGRKVIPFLKEEYFQSYNDKLIFKLITEYVDKYNSFPTKEALAIDLSNKDGVNESTFKECRDIIEKMEPTDNELPWMLDQTEKFCQDRAVYNAIMSSIQILDDKSGKTTKGAIPQILSDALAVSFDSHIGHDFIEDFEERYDFYHRIEEKIAFDLEFFNKITRERPPRVILSSLTRLLAVVFLVNL